MAQKLKRRLPLILVHSDDDDNPSQEEDESIPDPKDTDINNSKKWKLPSGLYVGEIFDENVSANAKKAKNKKKFYHIQKSHIKIWCIKYNRFICHE
jgi:hypothetical protein